MRPMAELADFVWRFARRKRNCYSETRDPVNFSGQGSPNPLSPYLKSRKTQRKKEPSTGFVLLLGAKK